MRQVGGALARQVGHQGQPVGAGFCSQRQLGQSLVIDVQHACGPVEHPRPVECDRQRQELTGGGGESGDQSAGVLDRMRRDGGHHPGGADGDGDIPGAHSHAQ